ncbi:hypothetical protein [Chitinophaga sp. sic0106]|uniref:hypothetical protein n=1 Tax=Chitinophaga sp. sic0106 TaxID=2854785 RepID=UPI001C4537D8|nr:hypothetical protein [Chitinophaga sp. sic0106]MBV7530952.1 hypothetical protein [Chitinophaga sp. sic0106]
MEKIQPFKTAAEAIDSLDNGGRFYNIFTHSHDQKISEAEVSKVAGLFFEKQKAMLFLEMAMDKLDASAKAEVVGRFDDNLKAGYEKFKPVVLSPAEALNGPDAANVIIRGTPKSVHSDTYLTGFILVPVVNVFTLIPVSEYYDAYEIRDEVSGEVIVLAAARDKERLPETHIIMGGVLKTPDANEEGRAPGKRFLEVSYYVEEML